MITRLQPVGDEWGVIIDPSILERLGVDENTRFEVKTDGESVFFVPIRDSAAGS